MAVVWLAQNIALEMDVAVKILRAGLTSDPRLVARIRQEAKVTASLAHKNIVQVYDYGVTSWGAPFIVMELLRGETLAQRLAREGRLRAADAVRTLLLAMKGITVAHAKGIVHRDLKPENVFLAQEDNGTERPKVLDFGVSFVRRASDALRSTRDDGLIGTPSYLAPEVIAGQGSEDVRCDVWALGVMLHEAITGELPFQGRSVHQLLDAISHAPHPAMADVLSEEVDEQLQRIVDRALAKDPGARYAGVRELFDELNVWMSENYGRVSVAPNAPQPPLARVSDSYWDVEQPTLVGPALDGKARTPPSLLPLSRNSSPDLSRDYGSSPPPSSRRRPSMSWNPAEPEPLSGVTKMPAPRRVIPMLAAFAIGIAVTVLFFVFRREHAAELGSGPARGQEAVAVLSTAPAVTSASLDVTGLPAQASLWVDGALIERLPAVVRGGRAQVRVEAPGFAPWSVEISVNGAVVLPFGGERLGGAQAPGEAQPAPR